MKRKIIDDALINMLALDLQPASIVDFLNFWILLIQDTPLPADEPS